MEKFIPLSVPNLKGNEKKYINEAIDSEWVSTAGQFVNRFEGALAQYVKVSGAVACQSGTAGLHLALTSMDINASHGVIVPTLTFIAAVNPVRYIGAEPIFMDCDESLCMDPIKLKQFCEEACTLDGERLIHAVSGKHIKALIVVHVFGNMADMESICAIAEEYHLQVIEDATEALGTYYTAGKYEGRHAGTIGDIGVYSFNGNKIITTGGGGMVVAQKPEVLQRIKYLSTQAKDDEIYFVHHEVGYNYRMTNLQAALGVAQLEQLEHFIETKGKNYLEYMAQGVSLLSFREGIRPNYWFYSYLLPSRAAQEGYKESFIDYLNNNRIQARSVWGLIHEQKPYEKCRFYKIEVAKSYHDKLINLPCSSNLSQEDVLRVSEKVKEGLERV